ncbi:hypothetical protein FRC16_002657 [Serendipita sp. 398]|nr:hypothetical protein FRC16_002657 [Serendipita sp. 398]
MYRPHPYAGYGPPPGRRADSPTGPGPDRSRPANRGVAGPGRGGRPRGPVYNPDPSYQGPNGIDNPYGDDGYNYPTDNYEGFNQYESGQDHKRRPQGEEKVHDPLIEERLQRERPCRTLFIRNIKYETDSIEFRRRFEEFGEIKTFFDLISHRGMVFCTYFDMRAAERAKERLQGTELAGRPIDVHYSLPRDDQKNEPNQGIIVVTLIESPTKSSIDDVELRRKLTSFGDVKSITPNDGRGESRLVEFYDLRSAEEAHGKLRHQSLQDGILETEFSFLGDQVAPGPAMQERARMDRVTHVNARRGRGRGRGGYDDRRGSGRDWEEDHYGRDRGRMSPSRYEERWRERSPPPRARSNGDLAVCVHLMCEVLLLTKMQAEREKMEQAKKVQDLLAALKGTGSAPGGSMSHAPAPAQAPYYPPPPAASSAPLQPTLPPNMAHLAALLQQAASLPPQQQAQAAAAAIQQFQAAPTAYPGMPAQTYAPMPPPPPPPNHYPGGQPNHAPYGYPQAAPSTSQPSFTSSDVYALLGQKQPAPPPSSMPPDSARYNYSTSQPPQGGPAPTAASNAQSIQDIMALLKR